VVLTAITGAASLWEGKCEVNTEYGGLGQAREKWVAHCPQPCTFSAAVIDRSEVAADCGYRHAQGLQC
jgi:hypothetical protein